jgi:5-methylcytosine-specific restriction protein A
MAALDRVTLVIPAGFCRSLIAWLTSALRCAPDALMGTHRQLYHRARWLRLRRHQLLIEPTCRFCRAQGKVVPATVADHVVPHKGDANAFWTGVLQSLCEGCHNRAKQQQERQGYMNDIGVDGMPLDPNHPAYAR